MKVLHVLCLHPTIYKTILGTTCDPFDGKLTPTEAHQLKRSDIGLEVIQFAHDIGHVVCFENDSLEAIFTPTSAPKPKYIN